MSGSLLAHEIVELGEQVFTEVHGLIGSDFKLNESTLVDLINIGMRVVGTYKNFKGKKVTGTVKKEIVLSIINRVIDIMLENDDDKSHLHDLVKTLVPSLINFAIDISKGNIKFNSKGIITCISKCCKTYNQQQP